ncbi:MAG: flagellar basal body rod protein FlgC [Alphaproteobacteria bacterium]|nr:flagellar basal body rod protein FlgC [Alphaproteobacteria bacterium]
MTDLMTAIAIAGSGMTAQSERLKIVAQNVANVDSTAQIPGGDPYRRKTISFKNVLNKQLGARTVRASKIGTDPSPFEMKYDPGHPAADLDGYVKLPNVNIMIEMMDMREAQRSYEANLNVIDVSKQMVFSTLSLLK